MITIKHLSLGQRVQISKKEYIYEGVKKVRGKIGRIQKIVFQGKAKDDQVLYDLKDASLSLEDENISIIYPAI